MHLKKAYWGLKTFLGKKRWKWVFFYKKKTHTPTFMTIRDGLWSLKSQPPYDISSVKATDMSFACFKKKRTSEKCIIYMLKK